MPHGSCEVGPYKRWRSCGDRRVRRIDVTSAACCEPVNELVLMHTVSESTDVVRTTDDDPLGGVIDNDPNVAGKVARTSRPAAETRLEHGGRDAFAQRS